MLYHILLTLATGQSLDRKTEDMNIETDRIDMEENFKQWPQLKVSTESQRKGTVRQRTDMH